MRCEECGAPAMVQNVGPALASGGNIRYGTCLIIKWKCNNGHWWHEATDVIGRM